ncbi:MAG: glycoside hydrolase family 2 [Ruminococcaceae bacterium]|nr:glycoside hydrolase family 2 [Oscillospiraceae bacterium]
MSNKKQPRLCALKTPFEDAGSQTTSWQTEYPRPQLRRDSYISLCGEWKLSVRSADGKTQRLGNIQVPFPPESRISGIERQLARGERYVYEISFALPSTNKDQRVIMHFDAVDQIAAVTLNDHEFSEHVGGYLPFELDVTECVMTQNNVLVVEVRDELDRELAWGKQKHDRGGMWYTPISGIWKAVWLEIVPKNYIQMLHITPTLDSVTIEMRGGKNNKIATFFDGDKVIKQSFSGSSVSFKPEKPQLWTPETPHLYEFEISDGTDTVRSYFALRTVSIEKRNQKSFICLNGKPYFCHGLLDQGYFPDGIYTPASPDGLLYDIKEMKALGFNTLRKHIKIEHELFYYYCDKYGMLVFQDMVNSGNYSFLLDTALPTIGLKRGITHRATKLRRKHFIENSKDTISLLYNHPSVIYYTVFNEGWGQFDADENYKLLKACDKTRIFDATSGWFFGKHSDVDSHHIYFKPLKLKGRQDRPLVLSEFGGYSLRAEDHVFNLDKNYGYSTMESQSAFEDALCKLYREQVIPQITQNGLCATIYTQVSDVEDETNGLLTYDRQVCKVRAEKMLALASELFEAFDAVSK